MTTPHPRPPEWRPDRDLVLSLAAGVGSVCALGVSVDNAPDAVTRTLGNAGVGPAQVAWVQATFDGAAASR